MRVYEELLFNNLEGFLLACFPITRKLLGTHAWRVTVRHFFAEHRCASPLFRDIPGEFLAWMATQTTNPFPQRPYLYEFMHYEWLELAVSIAADEPLPAGVDAHGDLLAGRPILNPTLQLVRYHYPVHRIGPRFKCAEPDGQIYNYLVYRDEANVVRFVELNALTARLLELLKDGRLSGQEALQLIVLDLAHERAEAFLAAGHAILEQLRHAGAVLGAGTLD